MSDINSWSATDANNTATPPDGFPENMAYSSVNNAARAVMGGMKRFFADIGGSLAAGGSADAYTLTLNSTYAAYFEGMLFSCSIPADCTGGAVTMNVNAIGAASVVDQSGNAPGAGTLKSGGVYTFFYDGTNFQVATALLADGVVTTAKIADQAVTPAKTGLFAIKASDESVTSSTTLQDDDDLQLTLAANSTYKFDAWVEASSASAVPDMKFAWTAADGTWIAFLEQGVIEQSTTRFIFDQGTDPSGYGRALSAPEVTVLAWQGVIKTGGAGGLFRFRWAQQTSDATATVVRAGSWVKAVKLD